MDGRARRAWPWSFSIRRIQRVAFALTPASGTARNDGSAIISALPGRIPDT